MTYLIPSLSGLLLAISFRTVIAGWELPYLGPLTWFALIPYGVFLLHASNKEIIKATLLLGLLYNALTSYWIIHALYIIGGLSFIASFATLFSLSSLLALILTLCVMGGIWLVRRRGLPFVIVIPIVWVVHEWIRSYGPFGGYPWSQLAYTQWGWSNLIQSVDLFGVYGLGFILVFGNVILAKSLDEWQQRRFFAWKPVVALGVIVFSLIGYGHYQADSFERNSNESPTKKISLIQPNILQSLKWDPEQADETIAILNQLTEESFTQDAEFVIWPETAYPDTLPATVAMIREMSHWQIPVLASAVMVGFGHDSPGPTIYNSAIHINPGGEVAGRYSKTHLVPLGEYVPLKNILSFLSRVVPAIGDFTPGASWDLIEWNDISYGVTICYEDLFPEISRGLTKQGARFLVNVTNDAWYGESSARWQHLEFSRFRAIENRRAVIRSSNDGVTAMIGPSGRVLSQLPITTRASLIGDVPLLDKQSFYTRYGDWPWLISFFLLLAICWGLRNSQPHAKP